VRACIKILLITLSALAFLTGCKSAPQKDGFLHADDEGVVFIQWTREGMQIRGTIDISEKNPDNEIKTTLISFDGISDGGNVTMNLKSSWTARHGDKADRGRMEARLKDNTLILFTADAHEPMEFRRATTTEHDEATRKLQMSAALNKGAK
jgi:hypothetical protein